MLRGAGIALFDGREDAGDGTHGHSIAGVEGDCKWAWTVASAGDASSTSFIWIGLVDYCSMTL